MLLGRILVRRTGEGLRLAGRIVETEAYLGIADRAAHSFGGRRTPRVEPMYGPPGTAYVYFTYGMHHCFNVVCGEVDEPVAVLIRALEPTEGVETMRLRRTRPGRELTERDLCSGPAKLCQAFDIDRRHSGIDLARSGELWIEQNPTSVAMGRIRRGARIGIDSAGDWADKALRWWIDGNPHVSVPGPR